ncbi:MAG: hypothetical protein PHY16_06495 [Methylobacter sp.]|nr:hypothetical protein [Methylobacter sp.]
MDIKTTVKLGILGAARVIERLLPAIVEASHASWVRLLTDTPVQLRKRVGG